MVSSFGKSVVSYCKVFTKNIFSAFEVELVASVIEISENFFSSKKYGLSRKETKKKKTEKKENKGKKKPV